MFKKSRASAPEPIAESVTSSLTSSPVADSTHLSYHDPESNMGNFGNKFRKARESKKLSLDDVSNVTKIGSRMLKAIEEENFDLLPGGVFNKGFIRAYAKHVGLNSEYAVAEYLACLHQEQDSREGQDSERRTGADRRKPAASSAPASNNAVKTQSPADIEEELPGLHLPRPQDIRHKPKEYLDRPSSGIPWLTMAVILVIILAAALLWIRHSRHARTGSKLTAPSGATTAAAPAAAKGVTQSAAPPATSPSPDPPLHSAAPKLQNANQIAASGRIAASAPTAASSANSNQPSVAKTDTAATQSAAKAAAALNLVIRAAENSWISVTADGQSVTHETLIAPAHTTVRANREIVVRVGNAAGVTFSWKGEEVPAQGAEGEVKTIVFDTEGMHMPAPPSPSPQNASPQN